MASTTKTTKFNVKPNISLEYKVYPKTYYHRNKVDIEVDEHYPKLGIESLDNMLDFD